VEHYFCSFSKKSDFPETDRTMTPQNRSRERLSFPARADHVLERIRIITRELDNIQSEIVGKLSTVDRPDRRGLVDDATAVRVLEQFRGALDQMRNMLWLCTQTEKKDGRQHDRQVAQAAALLRALAPSASNSSSAAPPSKSSLRESGTQGPISFFDRLDRVIDNYVEGGGTLVEPNSRRRPKT
jgi:hypothetical protein